MLVDFPNDANAAEGRDFGCQLDMYVKWSISRDAGGYKWDLLNGVQYFLSVKTCQAHYQ